MPQFKRKQFSELKTKVQRNSYQFLQIIIKVYIETCVLPLEAYMYDFKHKYQQMTADKVEAYIQE